MESKEKVLNLIAVEGYPYSITIGTKNIINEVDIVVYHSLYIFLREICGPISADLLVVEILEIKRWTGIFMRPKTFCF